MFSITFCPYCGKNDDTAPETTDDDGKPLDIFVAEIIDGEDDWHDHAYKWSCGHCSRYYYVTE